MRDLTPVRLTGGGTALVLVDSRGEEYVIPLDAKLRKTLGLSLGPPNGWASRDHDQPGAPRKEPTMESTLRPRDIQARIRAGESAADVAAVAGTSVDKVMIFASPVLAERAHIARSAQSASVRRRTGDAGAQMRTLGPAAAARLREEGVDPESVEWDAWRRDDGRWTLTAAYHHDAQRRLARFSFDQPGHFVTAEDDEGRWLVGDGSYGSEAGPSRAEQEEARRLRLAPSPRYPAVVELGDDALELVSEGDADWISPQVPVQPTARTVVEPSTGDAEVTAEVETAPDEPVAEVLEVEDPDPAPPTLLPRREAGARKPRGRASVPTWDEIMFGGGRGE